MADWDATFMASPADSDPVSEGAAKIRELKTAIITAIKTDTINEYTGANGVTIDSLKIKDAGFAIGSDADGDTYYRASGALARLAKGAANLKMFMNAGATAPEWAVGMGITAFTRLCNAAGGDVTYTGAGFMPSAMIAIVSKISTANLFSIGMSVGSVEHCVNLAPYTVPLWTIDPAYIISASLNSSGSSYQLAVVKNFTTDGVVLTWTSAGAEADSIDGAFLYFR